MRFIFVIVMGMGVLAWGVWGLGDPTTQKGGAVMSIVVKSSAFGEGKNIPRRYTGEGRNVSPPLSWDNLPKGTMELALIVDDPDAPRPEPWVHWVIYKIPVDAPGLSEDISHEEKPRDAAGALQGKNSSNKIGYEGPMPPKGHGVHHYHFVLYALDAPLQLKAGLDKQALLGAMAGHVLGQGELVGTYQRE